MLHTMLSISKKMKSSFMKPNAVLIAIAMVILQSTIIHLKSQSINYQGVVRDAQGNILVDDVMLMFDFRLGSANGASLYIEEHEAEPDQYGVVNLGIGKGMILQPGFDSIPWGDTAIYVVISLKHPIGGSSTYTEMGSELIRGVPFELRHNGTAVWEVLPGGDIFYEAGKVGINTNTPQAQLDINGDMRFTGQTFTGTALDAGFRFNAPNITSAGGQAIAYFARDGVDKLGIDRNGGIVCLGEESFINMANNNTFTFRSNASIENLVTITDTGFVGFGTSTPERLLHLEGKTKASKIRITTVSYTHLTLPTNC